MQPTSGIRFPLAYDTSRDVGIKETIGHAAALFDADGDGLLDVLLAGPNRVALFRNLGNWRFEEVLDTGFRQEGYWQGVAVGDVDNDGRPDLFLAGFGCAALYRNRGGGRFEDITEQSGLGDVPPEAWQTGAAFADVDLDGRLDLYVGRYVDLAGHSGACTYPNGIVTACGPDEFGPQRGVFYRGIGEGRFVEATAEFSLGEAEGKALGVAFGDIDDDGYPDLYIANDRMPCDLFLNRGGRGFVSAGLSSGTALGIHGGVQSGMGAAFGDYNDDGLEDLVVTNYRDEPMSLYRNEGSGRFLNAAFTSGLGTATLPTVGWGVQWVDLDNDGLPELVVANGHPLHRIEELDPATSSRQPLQVFRNAGEGRFIEVTHFGEGWRRGIAGRALCVGDIDNDGRMDLLVSDIEGEPLLLRNMTPTRNRWLRVRLAGRGIIEGATIRLSVGNRSQTKRSVTSGSYYSASDPRVHFGCGSVGGTGELEIRWPSGVRTTMTNVFLDREVVVLHPEQL
ncbi:MAG: CRTAC1 family protein [Verrucomicrobiae bacterium]|nr:CRTAC1 family protein [Verrucomicrobiae bacterium]